MSRLAERFIDRPFIPEVSRYPFSVQETVVAGDLGQCGGVRMALKVTKDLLEYADGKIPIYANNAPVHNKLITEAFQAKGLVIEPEIDKILPNSIWILSAHGTSPEIVTKAKGKGILVVNVECPLVTRVRKEAARAEEKGEHVVYRGAKNHPEPSAILGGLKNPQSATFITDETDFSTVRLPSERPIRVLNQTTLSTRGIKIEIDKLRDLNPGIKIPDPMGICYATDNRQDSLYGIFSNPQKPIDFLVVVGSKNSHNSQELKNIGVGFLGKDKAVLVDSPDEINPVWFSENIKRVGLTSGASVLDEYTIEILEWFRKRGSNLTFLIGKEDDPRFDDLTFPLPQNDIANAKAYLDKKVLHEN